MELVLHVGPGKTGSSTIQSMLLTYSETLLEYGIHSMKDCRALDGSHHQFARMINDAGMGSLEDIDKLTTVILSAKKFATDCNVTKIVASSDLFANLDCRGIDILKCILDEYDSKLTVVMYFRNLYELAIRTLQQQIKNGKNIRSLYSHKTYTYFSTVKSFADVVGLNNIIFRNYNELIEKKTNIFNDFIEAIGRNEINEYFKEINVNKSISRVHLQLFNYFNGYFKYPSSIGELQVANGFRWAILNVSNNEKLTISSDEALSLNEHFLYDKELFIKFLPDFLDILGVSKIYQLPESIIGDSFTDTVCKRPDVEFIDMVFGAMQTYSNEPDFINCFQIKE
jgi:hypothetical protein